MVATSDGQRHVKEEVPLLGGPSTGDLDVWGNGVASLGSVPTVGASKVPDTCLAAKRSSEQPFTSQQ